MYRYGQVIPADTVHHIETATERPDLFYCAENLIPVSSRMHRVIVDGHAIMVHSHAEIHERYERENKNDVIKEILEYKKKFDTGG